MFTDYYTILEIDDSASHDDIKAKYRILAKINHPDRNQGNVSAKSKMQSINEAYSILRDNRAKVLYDVERRSYYNYLSRISFQKELKYKEHEAKNDTYTYTNEKLSDWIHNAKSNAKKNKVGLSNGIANLWLAGIPFSIIVLIVIMNILKYPNSPKIAILKSNVLFIMGGVVLLLFFVQLSLKNKFFTWVLISLISFGTSIFLFIRINDAGPLFAINLFFTIPSLIVASINKRKR